MQYKFEYERSRVAAENLAYHDQAADSYNHTMDKNPANKILREQVKEKLSSLLSSGCVLDFGGGTGLDLEWLTRRYQVLFCEPSVPMREQAIHYNDTILRSDAITFLEGDKTDFTRWDKALPFTQPCDAVLSDFGALNYIPDVELLFRNVGKVLKPGGHFVLMILRLGFKKRMKWHRRNAIASLLFGNQFVMYIPFDNGQRQTVFVHSLKKIRKASAPYFTYAGHDLMGNYDFTLIHLIRNEKQD